MPIDFFCLSSTAGVCAGSVGVFSCLGYGMRGRKRVSNVKRSAKSEALNLVMNCKKDVERRKLGYESRLAHLEWEMVSQDPWDSFNIYTPQKRSQDELLLAELGTSASSPRITEEASPRPPISELASTLTSRENTFTTSSVRNTPRPPISELASTLTSRENTFTTSSVRDLEDRAEALAREHFCLKESLEIDRQKKAKVPALRAVCSVTTVSTGLQTPEMEMLLAQKKLEKRLAVARQQGRGDAEIQKLESQLADTRFSRKVHDSESDQLQAKVHRQTSSKISGDIALRTACSVTTVLDGYLSSELESLLAEKRLAEKKLEVVRQRSGNDAQVRELEDQLQRNEDRIRELEWTLEQKELELCLIESEKDGQLKEKEFAIARLLDERAAQASFQRTMACLQTRELEEREQAKDCQIVELESALAEKEIALSLIDDDEVIDLGGSGEIQREESEVPEEGIRPLPKSQSRVNSTSSPPLRTSSRSDGQEAQQDIYARQSVQILCEMFDQSQRI